MDLIQPQPTVESGLIPRPYPQRAELLPWTWQEVTAPWLTRTLQNKYPGIIAESLEVVQLIDSHTTKLRVRVGFNAVGKAAGFPDRLCLKSNWSGGFDDVDICAIEARFYHFLADEMKVPTATCRYADWDDDGRGQGLIILDDLEALGGQFGNSAQHAGVDAVYTALGGLAKLHGSLWDSPLIAQDAAPWLQTSMRTPVDSDQVRIMWRWILKNLEDPNFRAIAPKHYLEEPRRVEWAFDRLGDYERAFDAPYCVILGDCHQGNTYILPSGERLWLDWQLVRRGRPWRDLTYFMIGALTIEERRQNQRDMLAFYRKELIATGASGVIELDAIWEQYRRWVMYGIQAWVANMDHWGQIGLPMNERFFAAGEDHGTWALLLGE
ncbi:oxidoreductase family protein [Sphingobium aromaticiconvertens]|uniref:oxidoreductase family protein n=1 Tax=Sphingobium aromaticiconvertens TaxID=365341 RepID=UPI0030161F92